MSVYEILDPLFYLILSDYVLECSKVGLQYVIINNRVTFHSKYYYLHVVKLVVYQFR